MLSEEVVRSTESNSSKVVHPVQLLAFICVDGISFGAPYIDWIPRAFPITQKVVAPYWDDSDLREKGLILYAALIEGQESRLNNSLAIFDIVNGYITDTVMKGGSVFDARWILAVRWINVCPLFDSVCNSVS